MNTRSGFRRVPRVSWLTWTNLLVVGVPLAVGFLVKRAPSRLDKLSAYLFGALVAFWLARRPGRTVQALIVLLPFHAFILSGLFALGVPRSLVRTLGLWKELALFSLVVAAVAAHRRRQWRLDRLDGVALAYIACVVAYYVAPRLFAQPNDVVLSTTVRNLALRADTLFVVLFLAVRHCGLDRSWLERLGRTALVVGVLVAAIGIYEFLFSASWNHLAVHTFQLQKYQVAVLKAKLVSPGDIRVYGHIGGRQIIRIGSVLLSALSLGPYLLISLAIAVERMARQRGGPWTGAAIGIVGAALLFTQTRSAIIGGIIIGFVALRPAPGRSGASRTRFALILAAVVLLALPLSSSSGLSARVSSTVGGHESSANYHIKSFKTGMNVLIHQPLGRGLGTSPAIGDRFDVAGRVTSENYYLQVGNEVGIHTMIAFVALTLMLLRRLWRATSSPRTTSDVVAAVCAAGLALAVGNFLLHVWQAEVVATTFWGLAGAALAVGSLAPTLIGRPEAASSSGRLGST